MCMRSEGVAVRKCGVEIRFKSGGGHIVFRVRGLEATEGPQLGQGAYSVITRWQLICKL